MRQVFVHVFNHFYLVGVQRFFDVASRHSVEYFVLYHEMQGFTCEREEKKERKA